MMIFNYGFSLIGKSHIIKGTVCQDSHRIEKMQNGWYIAAVADGVGSAKNSHIGSKIAVDVVVEFCKEYMPWDYNIISIKSMLRTAYNYAFKQILRESEVSGEAIESYDTTLSMVIYDGQRIIYGHSGDGAIIGLNTFGDYVPITRPQKGDDGISVIPLRAGYTQWVIDTYEEDLAAVLLMTDGVLDTLCPYLLRDSINKVNKVYIPLGTFFGDPKGVLEDQEKTKEMIEEFLTSDAEYDKEKFYSRLLDIYNQHIPKQADEIIKQLKDLNYPAILMQNEQDDKTIVGLLNTDIYFDDKSPEFYSEPDWQALQEVWNRKAYPHMYQEKVDNEVSKEENNSEKSIETDITEKGIHKTQKVDGDHVKSSYKEITSKTDTKRVQSNKVVKASKNSSGKKHDTRNSSSVSSNPSIKDDELSSLQRHEKPRKKGLLSKIGDIFD